MIYISIYNISIPEKKIRTERIFEGERRKIWEGVFVENVIVKAQSGVCYATKALKHKEGWDKFYVAFPDVTLSIIT